MPHCLFYDCLHYLLPIGLSGADNTVEEKDERVAKLMNP